MICKCGNRLENFMPRLLPCLLLDICSQCEILIFNAIKAEQKANLAEIDLDEIPFTPHHDD